MKNLKVKDLVQRLQCLDQESDVWFYFGKNYAFLKDYALTVLNKAREYKLNPTKDGVSRNVLLSDFAIKSDPNGTEYADITFEPNFECDGYAEEKKFYECYQYRSNRPPIPELDGYDKVSREKGEVKVDGIKIETEKEEFVSANMLSVEVGTTGYCGGDSGHGGRTYLRIHDEGCTDLRCKVHGYFVDEENGGADYEDKYTDDAQDIEITLGGDCEMDTFIAALRYAADTLEQQKHHITFEHRKEAASKMSDPKTTGEEEL